MGSWSRAALVVLCAVIVGEASRLGSFAPVLVAGGLAGAAVVVLRWRDRRGAAPFEPAWFAGPLAAAWLVAGLLPLHTFSFRPITATGPTLDAEAAIQLFGSAAVGAVAVLVIRTVEPSLDRLRPPLFLFLLPVWTTASALWSAAAPYALARGVQLLMLSLLAWATVALGRVDAPTVGAMADTVLRWFPRITLVLIALGIAFGPVYVKASEANLDRFTWMGAHPLASGMVLATALVIVLVVPAATLRTPRVVRLAMGVAFAGALVPNHSRQSWLGVVAAVVAGLVLAGHLTRVVRWIGAPLVGLVAVAGIIFQGPELWDYVLRNEDTDALSTGNGRLELWGIGFDALRSPLDWLIGLGHGITRTVFVAEAPWARSAHSSALAALVSLGLVGLVSLLVLLGTTVVAVWRARLWRRTLSGFALTLLLVLVTLNGVVADNLVIPNLSSSLLYLVAAVAIVRPWPVHVVAGPVAAATRAAAPVALGRRAPARPAHR